jgi:hypothetical protein
MRNVFSRSFNGRKKGPICRSAAKTDGIDEGTRDKMLQVKLFVTAIFITDQSMS